MKKLMAVAAMLALVLAVSVPALAAPVVQAPTETFVSGTNASIAATIINLFNSYLLRERVFINFSHSSTRTHPCQHLNAVFCHLFLKFLNTLISPGGAAAREVRGPGRPLAAPRRREKKRKRKRKRKRGGPSKGPASRSPQAGEGLRAALILPCPTTTYQDRCWTKRPAGPSARTERSARGRS